MTIYQILAWPGTGPSILLTTAALHYTMFSRRLRGPAKGMMVVLALTLPSLAALLDAILMPAGPPRENLMPGLGEAMLLAICIPLTTLSAIVWLIRRERSIFH